MEEHYQQFFKTISTLISITDDEVRYYSNLLSVKQFNKGDLLLQAGDVCRNIFFINRGICRTFFLNAKGNECTFHFAMENGFITDYESFLSKQPAYFSIQALEPVEAVVMTHHTVHDGYINLNEGEKLGRVLAERYLFVFTNKVKSIYTEDAKTRYKNMNNRYPDILQRVPQHIIASYLNITPVHLSRLRNEL
ncbi:MAG: Crp/Fnr family transcriptional regulator [Bacteroidales bacterium]